VTHRSLAVFKESAKELDWRVNFIPGNGPILSRRNTLATI
jgi:hypothetical protein